MGNSSLKQKILKNPGLYTLVAKLVNLCYLFSNGRTVKGTNNKINISPDVLLKGVKIICRGKNNSITIGSGCRLKNVRITVNGSNNTILIGKNVAFYEWAYFLIEGDNCTIKLSDKVTVGSANFFAGEGNTNIYLGEDCMLSRDVKFDTSDFHSILDKATNHRINRAEDVYVGNHVWIGNGSHIYKGAYVADDSVIGIRAFVNKKFTEPNLLLVGQPAKVVKTGVTWSREKL